jgi:acyl dehydratase
MPIDSALVGSSTSVHRHDVDARWTMAFSAALGDTGPHYLDTTSDVVAHPLFPIAPEWAVHLEGRDQLAGNGLTPDERLRSVHATHDCHIHRLVRPGDRLDTRATVVLAEARRPGAYVVTRLDTTDADGEPVCTTWQASVYRGVAVDGGDRVHADPPPLPAAASNGGAPPLAEIRVPVPANLAHVYSECARIWNPIHTDVEVARRMGLPDIILHGSATLALAVSRVVDHAAGGDPNRVRRLGGMFRGMVLMPSEIRLRLLADEMTDDGRVVAWDVLNAEAQPAITKGFVVLAP